VQTLALPSVKLINEDGTLRFFRQSFPERALYCAQPHRQAQCREVMRAQGL
jgi:hypothetical protein